MLHYSFKRKAQIALLGVILLASACKNEYVCPVPNVERFEFLVTVPTHEIMTDWTIKNYGYNKHGVIVFRYNRGDNEVFAFDATCPDSEGCIASGVIKHDGLGYGVCNKCKARYSLTDGKHTSKKIMLRPYSVQKMATDSYRVYNY